MNFFEHQDKARNKTSILVFYFIVAILCIVVAINAIVYWAISIALEQPLNLKTITAMPLWIYITGAVIGIILIGTLIKWVQLRNGGKSLAKMVGARPINQETATTFKEKQFVNIVEEMSIASGVPMPSLYTMDEEDGINAFVAGIHPLDTIMVVTKGALEQFSRDEMQGVVGHEFSHIFNGDMRINLKLIGVLAGLLAIGQIGYFMIRSNRYKSSRNQGNGGLFLIMGIGVLIIGYIGIFFGRIIKAAVSRQREYLADASSVQFTRDPAGIANALRKIKQSSMQSNLKTQYAEDLSHFCFGAPFKVFFGGLLATHPPLDKRIAALDPQGAQLEAMESEASESPGEPLPEGSMGFAGSTQSAAHTAPLEAFSASSVPDHPLVERTGTFQESQLNFAKSFLHNLPTLINQATHDHQSAHLVIIALFIPNDKHQTQCFNIVAKKYSPEALNQVKQYHQALSSLSAIGNMPLVNLCLPALKGLEQADIKSMIDTIEAFPILEDRLGILKVSILALLTKQLQKPGETKKVLTTYDPITKEIAQLISLIISGRKLEPILAKRLFNQSMQAITVDFVENPNLTKITSLELQHILSKCDQLSYVRKAHLLQTCVDCLERNDKVDILEVELITAIALALGCPIPPLV